METGGVSLDRLETKLKDTLAEYQSHWDFAADLPEGGAKRGIQNEWKKEVGKILQAYYVRERLAGAQTSAGVSVALNIPLIDYLFPAIFSERFPARTEFLSVRLSGAATDSWGTGNY